MLTELKLTNNKRHAEMLKNLANIYYLYQKYA